MKSKYLLFCGFVLFLIGIYSWSCSSSRKDHPHKHKSPIDSGAISSFSSTPSLQTSSSAAVPDSKPAAGSISISTTHAVPLYKDIHSGVTSDIFFAKRMQPRDILSDPYFSFMKAFNFNSLQYSGGSISDHDHVIVGDTKISGGKGDGYNISAADCQARGEDINTVQDGVGTVHFGKDFFNEYCALLNKLGIHGDIIANVQGGTLEELYWKIDQAHAKRVIFGVEQNLESNSRAYPDGKAYKEKITKWIAAVKQKYPNIIIVIDAAPVYRPTPRFTAWNDQLQGMQADEVRMYLWDMYAASWQPDQNQNLATMNEIFNSTFPKWFDQVRQEFPGKKASIWQWGIKGKSDLYNTMTACIYIARVYKFMIDYNKANNNFIGYASFMSLKSLNRDGEIINHAYALQTCGKLFTGNKRVLDLDVSGLKGVSGVACDENGKYTLLLINETGNEVSIPGVNIDNSTVQGKKFTITSLNASSLGSTNVSMDTKTYSSISLHPYSVNIVEF